MGMNFLSTPVEAAAKKMAKSKCAVKVATLTPKATSQAVNSSQSVDPKVLERIGKKAAQYFRERLRWPEAEELALLAVVSEEELEDYRDILSSPEKVADLYGKSHIDTTRSAFIRTYSRLLRSLTRTPSLEEVIREMALERQVEVSSLEGALLFGEGKLFSSLDHLKEMTRVKYPKSFRGAIDTSVFNEERLQRTIAALETRQRFIVTTAVAGSPVNRDYLESLLRYAEMNDADIIVIPANFMTDGLDPVLLNHPRIHVLTHTIELSPWLAISKIKLMAKQIEPLTGLDRLARHNQTLIVGSPKLHSRTIPSEENMFTPKRLFTTGGITDPDYNGEKYIQGRTDEIALHDHRLGALILERTFGGNNIIKLGRAGTFHMRHIEFIPEKKGFMDLNSFYTPTAVITKRLEALVLGDIHVGDTDQKLLNSLRDLIKKVRPKRVVIHDLFNGHSVSHHDRTKFVSLAQKAQQGELNLAHELSQVAAFINALLSVDPDLSIVIVPSNHDFWLHRYLQEGRFMTDPNNAKLAIELARVFLNGQDPLEYALKSGYQPYTNRDARTQHTNRDGLIGSGGIDEPQRVVFLKPGIGYRVGELEDRKVLLGHHGHVGANGGKASLKTLQKGADRAVFGHTHTDGRLNGTVNIGTFTKLKLAYNSEGISSWVQSAALVGPYGEIQSIQFKDGEWFSGAEMENETTKTKPFFMPDYPKVIPNKSTSFETGQLGHTGQIDQWGGH